MSCRGTKKRLLEFIEGWLSLKLTEQVGEHLRSCLVCRETARELQEAGGILRAAGRSRAPSGFKEAVLERIAIGRSPTDSFKTREPSWATGNFFLRFPRWATVGGILVIGMLVWSGFHWMGRFPGKSPGRNLTGTIADKNEREGNEMDDFVDFCLRQHSQFLSQQMLSDEGGIMAIQGRRPPVPPALSRPLGLPNPGVPILNPAPEPPPNVPGEAQTRKWWWIDQQR